MLTNPAGAPLERFDCDDGGNPIFLDANGTPSSASSAAGPLRWLVPGAMWEPSIRSFVSPGRVFSPDLGMTLSGPRYRGHITVLK